MIKLRSKKLKKDYSLFLDIYHNGERFYEYLKIHVTDDYTSEKAKQRVKPEDKEKFELAKEIKLKRELELLANDYDFIPAHKKEIDFIEFAKTKPSKNTNNAISLLKRFAGEVLPFSQITTHKINEFVIFAQKNKISNNSINVYIAVLKSIWSKAIQDKIVKSNSNPFDSINKVKGTNPQIEYLELHELQLLFRTEVKFNPQIKQAFIFACFTGLRFSDIQALKWENIVGTNIEFRQKKSKKEFLKIPLSINALNILTEIAPATKVATAKVFDILPASNAYINEKLKIWQLTAGLTKSLHFHISRHTFATLQISNDTDIYTVSKLLGHSTVTMTQKYAKVIDDKKQNAIDRMPEIKL